MKITIDTAQDSHTDIKKAIRLLQSIVEGHDVYTNAPSRNIFDDPSPALGPSSAPASEQAAGSAFASLFDSPASERTEKEEEKEDIPEIEFY